MKVDLPAPLGPSRPYIPIGIVSDTCFNACTPLEYVFERPLTLSFTRLILLTE